jgi:hypothetical protein
MDSTTIPRRLPRVQVKPESKPVVLGVVASSLRVVAAFPSMLAEDRKRRGFTVGQLAWRLGVIAGYERRKGDYPRLWGTATVGGTGSIRHRSAWAIKAVAPLAR